jgi:Xaa-Pro dipeptidase
MLDILKSQKAIREEGLAAWLFYNVFHRDEIAELVLEVPADRTNTRPWVCILFPDRPPMKIVHVIEPAILSHVPGDTILYSTRDEFSRAVAKALPAKGMVAADFSIGIPVGSFLDHGTALFLQSLGAALAPAEGLVARYLGTIDQQGRESHDRAGRVLHAAIQGAWGKLAAALHGGRVVHEGEVRDWIAQSLADAGLEYEGKPVAGAGRHTADPHFGVSGSGTVFGRGDVVQFDVWAREKSPGAVYADISWLGVCAPSPTPIQKQVFDAVLEAREAALSLLARGFAQGAPVRGAEVDRAARAVLVRRGFEKGIRHRTGHSIGTRVHGFGVNLDSVEFPDERVITEGSCFSIEPGIYLEQFGMRTEIDCCIHEGRPEVTGGERQTTLLTLE